MKEFWKKILKAVIVLAIMLSIIFVASLILALTLKHQDDKYWDNMSTVDKMYFNDNTNSDKPYVSKSSRELDLYAKLAGTWICPDSGEYIKFYNDKHISSIYNYERYTRLGYTDYYEDYYLKAKENIHFYSIDDDGRRISIYNDSNDSLHALEFEVNINEDGKLNVVGKDYLLYEKVNVAEYGVIDNNIKMTQLEVFYANQDIWNSNVIELGEEYESVVLDECYYAVTDLDKDDVLEIIKSGYAGEEKNAYSVIYEIQGDGSVKAIEATELLNPDKTYPHAPALYKYDYMFGYIVNNDTWVYLTNAITEYSDHEYEEEYGLMVFSNNRFGLKNVVSSRCVDNSVYTYFDSDHNTIDKEKYDELYNTYKHKGIRYTDVKWFSEITRENLGESFRAWKIQ